MVRLLAVDEYRASSSVLIVIVLFKRGFSNGKAQGPGDVNVVMFFSSRSGTVLLRPMSVRRGKNQEVESGRASRIEFQKNLLGVYGRGGKAK